MGYDANEMLVFDLVDSREPTVWSLPESVSNREHWCAVNQTGTRRTSYIDPSLVTWTRCWSSPSELSTGVRKYG